MTSQTGSVKSSRIDDPARLAALAASGLLNKGPDEQMDLLCETAHHLLRAPIAMVNILDDQMQTSVGAFPKDIQRSYRVKDTGCQHVVAAAEPISIDNTLLHPVMCISPVTTVLGVRAYLGVPIFYDDQPVGSFCVMDYMPRDWRYWDTESLKGLARLAGLAVETRGD